MVTRQSSQFDPLAVLADEFVRRIHNGEQPELSEYTSRNPELAEQIREYFPLLVMMEKAGASIAAPGASATHHQRTAPAPIKLPEYVGGFRIHREIGRGGMGVVYEAEQIALGRHVALKVLPAKLLEDKMGLERFRQEARVAAQLHHTNIVPVFEVGEDQGICYYAMQYIHGQSLEQVLDELRHIREEAQRTTQKPQHNTTSAKIQPDAPLSQQVAQSLLDGFTPPGLVTVEPDDEPANATMDNKPLLPGQSQRSQVETNRVHYYRSVARVGVQVAEALEYAHQAGVLHRDIKPSNLLLDAHSRVWITDFGLAKTRGVTLTQDGDIVGTLRYMAPERFRGQGDARSEVFSFGLSLYEMLVLRPAFDSLDRLAMIHRLTHEQPTPLRQIDPRIPRDLETIINKTIEKNPSRRYQSAGDLAEDLKRFLKHQPIRARRVTALERGWRWCRRNPLVAALCICVLLVAVAGFAGVLAQWRIAAANAREAQSNAATAKANENKIKKKSDELKIANAKLRDSMERLRSKSYNAHMNLLKHAWDAGGLLRVRNLLNAHIPKAGDSDLRDFEWYYFDRMCKSNLLTLSTQSDGLFSVEWRPDGKQIAAIGLGTGVQTWDARTGILANTFITKGNSGLTRIANSADGKYLATAAQDKSIKIWDAHSCNLLTTLPGMDRPANAIAFSPDGESLLSAAGDYSQPGKMVMWDIKNRKKLFSLMGFTGKYHNISFGPRGKFVSGIFDKNIVKVVDAQTGKGVFSTRGEGNFVIAQTLSPDGRHVAFCAGNQNVQLWDIETNKPVRVFRIMPRQINRIAFSPDGKRLACGSTVIHIWEVANGKLLGIIENHPETVQVLKFSPEGDRILCSAGRSQIRVWDARRGTAPRTFHAHSHVIDSIAITPDGKYLAECGARQPIQLLNATTGEVIHKFPLPPISSSRAVISSDGKFLAAACRDQKIRIWDLDNKSLYATLNHPIAVNALAFSPDAALLATADLGSKIHVWELRPGKNRLRFVTQGCSGFVGNLKFSPDGKLIAVACHDKKIRLWDAATGKLTHILKGHARNVTDVAFHPTNEQLISVSMDRTIKVWDSASGEELRTLEGHTGGIRRVTISPSGSRVATVGADYAVKLWDFETGEEVLTLVGDAYEMPSDITFNADGTKLVSAWMNGKIRIWEAPR